MIEELIENFEAEIKYLDNRLQDRRHKLRDLRRSIGIKACERCGRDISTQKDGELCLSCWEE